MKLILPIIAVVFSIIASNAQADMIVVNGRYIVAKDSIRGYFYRKKNKQTVFDIRWNDWSTQYQCEDTYDETRVEAALLNFAILLKETGSIDFGGFLDGEGFEACEKF